MMAPRGGDPGDGFLPGLPGFLAELVYARVSAAARARDLARPRVRAARPVISIGNLAAGGTGKTPFTGWLARRLLAAGHPVAIVARPVGGAVPGAAGDELALLAELAPGARIVAARQKAEGAVEAAAALAAAGAGGVVLVDDGFSHLRLERDLDLVLLDASRPLGNGHLLPYGPLREPPAALRRADALVLTRADRLDAAARAATHEALGRIAPGVAQAAARLVPTGLRGAADGAPRALAPGAPVVCLSGLARPTELARSAAALGASVVADFAHGDHHRFRGGEWREARDAARRHGALLVVSAKDAVRLDAGQRREAVILDVAWEWVTGGDAIEARVDSVVRGGR